MENKCQIMGENSRTNQIQVKLDVIAIFSDLVPKKVSTTLKMLSVVIFLDLAHANESANSEGNCNYNPHVIIEDHTDFSLSKCLSMKTSFNIPPE